MGYQEGDKVLYVFLFNWKEKHEFIDVYEVSWHAH
jgi:hypothetical protein